MIRTLELTRKRIPVKPDELYEIPLENLGRLAQMDGNTNFGANHGIRYRILFP